MFLLTRISNVSYLYCSCSFEKFTSSFAFVKEGRFSPGERRENGAGARKAFGSASPGHDAPALTFLCPIPRPRGIPAPVWFRFVPALVSVLSKYTRLLPQRCQKNAAQPYLSRGTRGGRGKRTFPFNSVIVPFCPAAVKPEGGGAFGYSPGSPFEKEGKAPESVEKEKRRRP